MMELMFLDLNALDLNVIIIWLLHSVKDIQDDGKQVFGFKRFRFKRYYNLAFTQCKSHPR
jgi:hypothetical protein